MILTITNEFIPSFTIRIKDTSKETNSILSANECILLKNDLSLENTEIDEIEYLVDHLHDFSNSNILYVGRVSYPQERLSGSTALIDSIDQFNKELFQFINEKHCIKVNVPNADLSSTLYSYPDFLGVAVSSEQKVEHFLGNVCQYLYVKTDFDAQIESKLNCLSYLKDDLNLSMYVKNDMISSFFDSISLLNPDKFDYSTLNTNEIDNIRSGLKNITINDFNENLNFDVDSQSIVERINIVSNLNNLIQSAISGSYSNEIEYNEEIDTFKYYYKLKFTLFNEHDNMNMVPDEITVNGTSVLFNVDNNMIHMSGVSNKKIYELEIKKHGFIVYRKKIRAKLSTSIDLVNEFNLGQVKLKSAGSLLSFVFEWGKHTKDLDFHVFTLNEQFKQTEHVFYKNMYSDNSKIYLNTDIRTGYGPEMIKIMNMKHNNYYVFMLHNYSLYNKDLTTKANEELKFHISSESYAQTTKIASPFNASNSIYWYFGFVVYNGRIIQLKKLTNQISTTPDAKFEGIGLTDEFKTLMQNSKEISNFSKFGIEYF